MQSDKGVWEKYLSKIFWEIHQKIAMKDFIENLQTV